MRLHSSIIAAALALGGCSERQAPSSQVSIVKGAGIVDRISQSTIDGLPHVNVWPVKGTPLGALAHTELFDDFAPGLTFDEARKRYGAPVATRTLLNRTDLRCYRRDAATLAVARELYFSSSPAAECWTVWAFPNDGGFRIDSIVSSNILQQVRSPSPPFYLVLRDSTPLEQSLWLRVDSPGITEIRWINSESRKKRKQ